MGEKKKEDLKEGVSEKLFQLTISYFVNHPDRWIRRREIQEALGIGKTQACRLFQALSVISCLDNNEEDGKPENSPIMYRLSSEKLKRAEQDRNYIRLARLRMMTAPFWQSSWTWLTPQVFTET